jgi:hypothetical protein
MTTATLPRSSLRVAPFEARDLAELRDVEIAPDAMAAVASHPSWTVRNRVGLVLAVGGFVSAYGWHVSPVRAIAWCEVRDDLARSECLALARMVRALCADMAGRGVRRIEFDLPFIHGSAGGEAHARHVARWARFFGFRVEAVSPCYGHDAEHALRFVRILP